MSNRKTQKIQVWDSYGSGFWHAMGFLSFILLILGGATFLFAGMRILYGDRWFVWFILAACGLASIAFSVFCMSLFPSWGSLVRRIRLAEARMEGAMSISEINRYEERENRRGSEIKDTVTESVGRVGRDILETKERVSNVESGIKGMSQDIKDLVRQAVQDVMVDPARDRRLNNLASDLEKMMEKKIEDIGLSVRDLQTQMAYQNETMLLALSKMGQGAGSSEMSSPLPEQNSGMSPEGFGFTPPSDWNPPASPSPSVPAGKPSSPAKPESPGPFSGTEKPTAGIPDDDVIPDPLGEDEVPGDMDDDPDGEPDLDSPDEAPIPADYF